MHLKIASLVQIAMLLAGKWGTFCLSLTGHLIVDESGAYSD